MALADCTRGCLVGGFERVGGRVVAGDPWDEPEYETYPHALKSPYRERRSAFGEQRYGALGIQPRTWRRARGPLP